MSDTAKASAPGHFRPRLYSASTITNIPLLNRAQGFNDRIAIATPEGT
jgi:hypothetical protein